jgi:hypothetical protein
MALSKPESGSRQCMHAFEQRQRWKCDPCSHASVIDKRFERQSHRGVCLPSRVFGIDLAGVEEDSDC